MLPLKVQWIVIHIVGNLKPGPSTPGLEVMVNVSTGNRSFTIIVNVQWCHDIVIVNFMSTFKRDVYLFLYPQTDA